MSDDSSTGPRAELDGELPATAGEHEGAPRSAGLTAGILLALVLATFAVYSPSLSAGFIGYDDDEYVTDNPYIQFGANAQMLTWAFTSHHSNNWHPLTWISHALDLQVFGRDAGGHHLLNVLFHCANTALLFAFLLYATNARWRSACVAALFALHPLHVESVAWIAERKDVLSTFFGLLTLLAYLRYAKAPGARSYLLVFVSLACGLMSKPMLVTLPFVLVLLDYWPLRRMELSAPSIGRRLGEKTPLLLLAALSCALTYWAQSAGGAVISLESFPLGLRVQNALVATVAYIGHMLWPSELSVIYPHPRSIPIATSLAAAALLAALTAGALYQAKRRPYLLVGWLWFIGTLVPVIGLVQVGHQAMADRYSYVPLIGLFIALTWGVAQAAHDWRLPRPVVGAATGALLLGLAALTWQQQAYWQSPIALFQRALAVTEANYLAHAKLGEAQANAGLTEAAIQNFQLALRIHPGFANTQLNLGVALWSIGRHEQGLAHMVEALRLAPGDAPAHVNLGSAYQQYGRGDEALEQFEIALRIDPANVLGHFNLGQTLFTLGRNKEAIAQLRTALSIDPNHAMSHNSLGAALATQGDSAGGLQHFQRAAELDPSNPMAFNNLGLMRASVGDTQGAIQAYEQALRLNPNFPEAQTNLRNARAAESE